MTSCAHMPESIRESHVGTSAVSSEQNSLWWGRIGERGAKDGREYADENVMRAMRLNAAKNMDTHEFVCALITLKNFSQEI